MPEERLAVGQWPPRISIPAVLSRALEQVLPGARLEIQSPLDGRELRLALIADALADTPLDGEIAERVMNNPLYWIFCWASGRSLAAHLLANPDRLRGKRVLDLGCGSGVVAIAAGLAGAREVVACDLDPLALRASTFNASLNGVDLCLCSDWRTVQGTIDLILVADVLYDRSNLPLLDALAKRAPEVLVADSRIRAFDRPPYRKMLELESCTVPDMDEAREFNRVSLYRAAVAP